MQTASTLVAAPFFSGLGREACRTLEREILKSQVLLLERRRSKCEASGKIEKRMVTKSGHYCKMLRNESYLREINLQPK